MFIPSAFELFPLGNRGGIAGLCRSNAPYATDCPAYCEAWMCGVAALEVEFDSASSAKRRSECAM